MKTATQQEAQELERKIAYMKETEMAVIVSQEQNEIQTFNNWGLDILPHRTKMEKREMDKEFKDADNLIDDEREVISSKYAIVSASAARMAG